MISFARSRKYFTNVFYLHEVEKTEVIFYISLYFWFYLQELEHIQRIGKSSNDLYYFQKVRNIRETNCKMYIFPWSRKINWFSVFLCTFDFISKNEKYCTNTSFLCEIKKIWSSFLIYIYLSISLSIYIILCILYYIIMYIILYIIYIMHNHIYICVYIHTYIHTYIICFHF